MMPPMSFLILKKKKNDSFVVTAPVKKGTDTVYSEVRNSKQGTTNILLLVQIPLILRAERNQATKQKAPGNRISSNRKRLHC